MSYNFEKRKEEIQKQIKENDDYINKSIDYKEFLNIYELYKNEMSELEFSEILGITYSRYLDLKNERKKVRILKYDMKISEEKKHEIKERIKEKGYLEKKIDYEKFLELYKNYKNEMSELEFAEILGIFYNHYYAMKCQGCKAIILKNEEISELRREEIIFSIKQLGYTNMKIDYKQFQKIYEPYIKEISEIKFAINILGIPEGKYRTIKCKANRKVVILKTQTLTEERKKAIIEELKHYANRIINYEEFLQIFSKYREEVTEFEFAEILGISSSSYKMLKTNRSRARILKPIEEVDDSIKNRIKNELIEAGYPNKKINYEVFLQLYQPYKDIVDEKTFAKIIGISQNSYSHIKNEGTNTIILKDDNQPKQKINTKNDQSKVKKFKKKTSEDELKNGNVDKEKIIRELQSLDIVKERYINYDKFKKIYEPYKHIISEKEFSKILGLSTPNYNNIKYTNQNAIINFDYILNRRIQFLFDKDGSYELDYFKKISEQYEISIKEILKIILTDNQISINNYYDSLTQKGFIFKGKKELSQEFLKSHSVKLFAKIHEYSRNIGKKFHLPMYSEDIAQDTLIYIIQNKR